MLPGSDPNICLDHGMTRPDDVIPVEDQSYTKHKSGSCVDTNSLLCSRHLQPYHCYSNYNRALCCRSCQLLKEKSPNPRSFTSAICSMSPWLDRVFIRHLVAGACAYGDRNAMIRRRGREHSCSSFIQQYGVTSCRWSHQLRAQCCKTCADYIAHWPSNTRASGIERLFVVVDIFL